MYIYIYIYIYIYRYTYIYIYIWYSKKETFTLTYFALPNYYSVKLTSLVVRFQ